MRDSITFDLDQPIEFPGQNTMTSITIRPFTGKDLVQCGLPFSYARDARGYETETVDVKASLLLVARMAGVPFTMMERMAAVDVNACLQVLRGFFFYKTPPTSSTDTSKPDDGVETVGSFFG